MDMLRDRHRVPRNDEGGLTDGQVASLIILERVGAIASIAAIFAIFTTFWAFKRLRTVPNLFIMMASIANAGAGAACIMGHDGLAKGQGSSLCQAQAFLLEMLMQSDPWWSLAMAINVFLVFFYGANTSMFRKYLWVYSIVCFGAPLIPALALLLLNDYGRSQVYGDATLWCWIEPEWSALRIYTYYLPIWICIFLSAMIYVAVGCHVFHRRNQLRNLTFSNNAGADVISDSVSWEGSYSGEKIGTQGREFYARAVTELEIHSTEREAQRKSWSLTSAAGSGHRPGLDIASGDVFGGPAVRAAAARKTVGTNWTTDGPDEDVEPNEGENTSSVETTCTSDAEVCNRSRSVGWYLVRGFGRVPKTMRSFIDKFHRRYKRVDAIKKAYLRTSAIFALSVLFTWIPSSINRVDSMLNPQRVNYPLNVASAFVLPLQGVWNAVIYFSTSWRPLCEELSAMTARQSGQSGRVGSGMVGMGGSPPRSCCQVNGSEYGSEPDSARRMGEVRAMRGSF